MCDVLVDRSSEFNAAARERMQPTAPKTRIHREFELHNEDQLDDEVALIGTAADTDATVHGLDYISHARLVEVTGEPDLTAVTFFQAQVDTESTSVADLGNLLPQLAQLKLSHSNICSFRDLGTSLRQLRVLWLNRAGLLSLDGLGSICSTIEELYIAFNHVTDLSPMADDEFGALRILDADSNEIADSEQIEFLGSCSSLSSLTLENNPVAAAPGYVVFVRESLPGLELLDDLPLDSQHRVFTEECGEAGELTETMVVSESIKLSRLGYDDVEYLCGAATDSNVPLAARPSTAMARPGTGARPCTSGGIRPATPFESCITGFGVGARPCTSLGRPGTGGFRPGTGLGQRPGTGLGRPGTAMAVQPTQPTASSSDLTFGSNEALCGGISRALRGRKKAPAVLPEASSSPEPWEEETGMSFSAACGVLPGDRPGGAAPAEGGGGCDIMTIDYDDSSDES
eukprot:TRINITY_DN45017_c0_g1_i2.p1 TRINITY_DN45017_c0_g1~~TRINITY_DN45017_c0_g1_i2.p1  ORF type:complete len:458 (+),score=93.82 TRINITY_DN45017_c0_g1_i2:224-1597(+)